MKIWILLILALVLLFLKTREGFNPATERPSATDPALKRAIEAQVGTTEGTKVAKYVAIVQAFYDEVYLPTKATPEGEAITAFVAKQPDDPDVDKTKVPGLLAYVFLSTPAPPPPATKDGQTTAPAGTATTTGTSTGGTSTSSLGPNSGGVGSGLSGKNVFGPVFTAFGGGGNGRQGGDSSKTNKYPQLLGGGDSAPSTRIDGVGIVNPSKNWSLTQSGDFPSSASLGSDENSKYLPFSRQPGDQDLIPDPYRVSRSFTTSSYSSKTDPVPFLTDFSAFQK